MSAELQERLRRLELVHRVGVALSAERNKERLVEAILLEAKGLCNADGGTLYLRTKEETLRFAIMRNDSLDIALGGTTGEPIRLDPIPLTDGTTGHPNLNSVATYCANLGNSVNIEDAYRVGDFDFSGTKRFDEVHDYRSKSFLTIPLVNNVHRVIGVLQLINAQDEHGRTVAFSTELQRIVEALASQAAVALDTQLLLEAQRELLEAFIMMIASAIDAKSPYTGAHCERVPELTVMLAEAACAEPSGPFGDFDLSEDEWYELKIAAWLHDCGKVTTPVHVMDKATKLETIFDRIEIVRARFEALERDERIAALEAIVERPAEREAIEASAAAAIDSLRDDLAFLEKANVGGEFLSDDDKARIAAIGARPYIEGGKTRPVLSENEIANLQVSRGTLTTEERLIINGHMVQTIRMLEALPFPPQLARVPEYAGGHHEKMDGTGYPKGIYAGDMSVPARIMAIADVFEALTAQDRPYKPGKTLSESMRIMGEMKRHNHLDPEVFDLFVRSGVYRAYGERFLPPELIDEVDEKGLLDIEPKPYDVPASSVRAKRWIDFLPEYLELFPASGESGQTQSLRRPAASNAARRDS